jgi:hypothetical protein
MPRPGRIFVIIAALLFTTLQLYAQQPDIDSLNNLIFARDLKTASRYAPPEIQEGLAKLTRDQRKELGRFFPIAEFVKNEGRGTMQRPSEGDAFIVYDEPNEGWFSHLEFYIVNRDYGDDRSDLTFRVKVGSEEDSGRVLLRIKFVYPEWRIYEVESLSDHKRFNLEDEKLVEKAFQSLLSIREESAQHHLTDYLNALQIYQLQYRDQGLPQTLIQLAAPEDEGDPDAGHAGLLPKKLTTEPYEIDRYRFSYKRKDSSRFTITARPVKFGITGRKSYLIDESGTVRFSDKDEAPTELSKPVE